jgi:hypothetical protein
VDHVAETLVAGDLPAHLDRVGRGQAGRRDEPGPQDDAIGQGIAAGHAERERSGLGAGDCGGSGERARQRGGTGSGGGTGEYLTSSEHEPSLMVWWCCMHSL